MTKYVRTEVVTLEGKLYVGGALTDADGDHKAYIEDKSGALVVDGINATKVSTGLYRYNYTLTTDSLLGDYKADMLLEYKSVPQRPQIFFEVVSEAV